MISLNGLVVMGIIAVGVTVVVLSVAEGIFRYVNLRRAEYEEMRRAAWELANMDRLGPSITLLGLTQTEVDSDLD